MVSILSKNVQDYSIKTMLCSLQYIDPATAVMMVLKAFMKYQSLTFSFAEFGSRVCQ